MTFSTTTTAEETLIRLLTNEQYDTAIQHCDAIDGLEKNPGLLQFKAMAHCHKGELETAKAIFLKAIHLKPNEPTLLYNYAEVLNDMGDTEESISVLSRIIEINPNFQAAQEKLNTYSNKPTEELNTTSQHLNRSLNPLLEAFSNDEVEKTLANHVERQKKSEQLKLKERPDLPPLDNSLLADEWLLAAEDALRAKQPKLSLRLCSKAIQISSNTPQVYALAGDAYLSLAQYNYAHLCYLIASTSTELDLLRQINLVSLAQALGDSELFNERHDALSNALENQESMRNTLQKISSRNKENCFVEFFPDKGPSRTIKS